MARVLPPNWRPAQRIHVGHDIYLIDRSEWLEIVERVYTTSGIRFLLADGTTFHARPTDKLQSRHLPKES